ncbi:hypothetical protein ACH5RR_002435 [Cinchona calisaya]|uniref:Uncharacterized protein n=1 Tax=Cinchona calisaya TaxID=153742 RepID=A0ABD3B6B0_9GENT
MAGQVPNSVGADKFVPVISFLFLNRATAIASRYSAYWIHPEANVMHLIDAIHIINDHRFLLKIKIVVHVYIRALIHTENLYKLIFLIDIVVCTEAFLPMFANYDNVRFWLLSTSTMG